MNIGSKLKLSFIIVLILLSLGVNAVIQINNPLPRENNINTEMISDKHDIKDISQVNSNNEINNSQIVENKEEQMNLQANIGTWDLTFNNYTFDSVPGLIVTINWTAVDLNGDSVFDTIVMHKRVQLSTSLHSKIYLVHTNQIKEDIGDSWIDIQGTNLLWTDSNYSITERYITPFSSYFQIYIEIREDAASGPILSSFTTTMEYFEPYYELENIFSEIDQDLDGINDTISMYTQVPSFNVMYSYEMLIAKLQYNYTIYQLQDDSSWMKLESLLRYGLQPNQVGDHDDPITYGQQIDWNAMKSGTYRVNITLDGYLDNPKFIQKIDSIKFDVNLESGFEFQYTNISSTEDWDMDGIDDTYQLKLKLDYDFKELINITDPDVGGNRQPEFKLKLDIKKFNTETSNYESYQQNRRYYSSFSSEFLQHNISYYFHANESGSYQILVSLYKVTIENAVYGWLSYPYSTTEDDYTFNHPLLSFSTEVFLENHDVHQFLDQTQEVEIISDMFGRPHIVEITTNLDNSNPGINEKFSSNNNLEVNSTLFRKELNTKEIINSAHQSVNYIKTNYWYDFSFDKLSMETQKEGYHYFEILVYNNGSLISSWISQLFYLKTPLPYYSMSFNSLDLLDHDGDNKLDTLQYRYVLDLEVDFDMIIGFEFFALNDTEELELLTTETIWLPGKTYPAGQTTFKFNFTASLDGSYIVVGQPKYKLFNQLRIWGQYFEIMSETIYEYNPKMDIVKHHSLDQVFGNSSLNYTLKSQGYISFELLIDDKIIEKGEFNQSFDLIRPLEILNEGEYNIKIQILTGNGSEVIYQETIMITNDIPKISGLDDLRIPYQEIALLQWELIDSNLDEYWIYKNGALISNDTIESTFVNYNFTSMDLGIHNITLMIDDEYGEISTDTVFVEIYDDIKPVINADNRINFDFVPSSIIINFTAHDDYPAGFNITYDSELLAIGNWTDGIQTLQDINLNEGEFDIFIYVWDTSGNTNFHQLTLIISSNGTTIDPISSPTDTESNGLAFTSVTIVMASIIILSKYGKKYE